MGEKTKKFFFKYWYIFYILAMLILALYHSVRRLGNIDFYPTNGDYQTYNVIRRALDGQTPFVDFANYLGMGALWVLAPFVALNNNLATSLFVSNYVVQVIFIIIIFVVFYTVTEDKFISGIVSLILPYVLRIPLFGEESPIKYANYFLSVIRMMGYPNNSLRALRAFLPMLYACIFYLYTIYYKKKHGKPLAFEKKLTKPLTAGITGLLIGVGALWSNDFGFACIGAGLIIFIVIQIVSFGKKIKSMILPTAAFVGGIVLGFLSIALISTKGNIGAYFKFAGGVQDYQYWYFGVKAGDKINSLIEFLSYPNLAIMLAVFLVAMGWCIYRLAKGKLNGRNLMFGFMYASTFIAAMIYIYGSGGFHFEEAIYLFQWLTVLALAAKCGFYLVSKIKKIPAKKIISVAMVAITVLYCGLTLYSTSKVWNKINVPDIEENENYIERLGGGSSMAESLNRQVELAGGGTLFSTYATAVDDMRGEFQPTGSDYIIHALGDEQAAAYVKNFEEGNYDFVQTPNMDVHAWEGWSMRQNWEFYCLLLSRYYVYYNDNNWSLWKRNEGNEIKTLDIEVDVKINKISDTYIEVEFTSDYKEDVWIDVCLNYEVNTVMNLFRLQTWKTSILAGENNMIIDTAYQLQFFYLPTDRTERTIPVKLIDGKTILTLESEPMECTTLEVISAEVGLGYAMNF